MSKAVSSRALYYTGNQTVRQNPFDPSVWNCTDHACPCNTMNLVHDLHFCYLIGHLHAVLFVW